MKLYFIIGLPTEMDDDTWESSSSACDVVDIKREYAKQRAAP